jgi:hypothetical protein
MRCINILKGEFMLIQDHVGESGDLMVNHVGFFVAFCKGLFFV